MSENADHTEPSGVFPPGRTPHELPRGGVTRSLTVASRLAITAVAVSAIVMGLPTLRGTFVGGDDHRLVLNHVLVNHPSLAHAALLFTIVHRDLYQPIPLLSFSAEFAVAGAFGFFDRGLSGGAWLFHLTNVLLHAFNAVLVWFVIVALQLCSQPDTSATGGEPVASHAPSRSRLGWHAPSRSRLSVGGSEPYVIATIAALFFAIHPLQVEVVAWVNGRMMLLSTMFALASLLTISAYLRTGRVGWAVGTALCVLLCMISKVRIGLPFLLFIPWLQTAALSRSLQPARTFARAKARGSVGAGGFWTLWLVCAAVTAGAVWVNVGATARSGMFAHAAEQFHGPRVVRALLALAWYLQHLVWPAGLAAWYPAPQVVSFFAPVTLRALLILAPGLAVIVWACRRGGAGGRWPEARWGIAWFLVTIASTLPIIPARNMLAADRYMYLPMVGVGWFIASVGLAAFGSVSARWSRGLRRAVIAVGGVSVSVAMVLTSWHGGSFYNTSILKTERIASLHPETPHVWARTGWAYHKAGNAAALVGDFELASRHQEKALECGRRELSLKLPGGWSEGHQVIGMSQLKLGRASDAIESLERGIEYAVEKAQAIFRLAVAYDELGRFTEALPLYEAAVEKAPSNNPTIIRLARLYRHFGRSDDAREVYMEALDNNAYEVPAVLGLAELSIAEASPDSYREAEQRLLALLDWMPENTAARTDLGVVHQAMGRTEQAIRDYEQVLEINPAEAVAALNLAQLYFSRGDAARARRQFESVANYPFETIDQVIAVHEFFVAQQEASRAVGLWEAYLERLPDSVEGKELYAWSLALTGASYPVAVAPRGDRVPQPVAAATGGGRRPREHARSLAEARLQEDPQSPIALATLTLIDLWQGGYGAAARRAASLAEVGERGVDARRRLLQALDAFDRTHPNVPWTFCIVAQLLQADGRLDGAAMSIDLCETHCDDPACRDHISALRTRITGSPGPASGSPPN